MIHHILLALLRFDHWVRGCPDKDCAGNAIFVLCRICYRYRFGSEAIEEAMRAVDPNIKNQSPHLWRNKSLQTPTATK